MPSLRTPPRPRPLRHVVLFKFKADATKEQVQQIVDGFRHLPKKIDGITAYEWGTDVSPEGQIRGLYALLRRHFQGRQEPATPICRTPAHKEFVNLLLPRLDKVMVVDYFAQK